MSKTEIKNVNIRKYITPFITLFGVIGVSTITGAFSYEWKKDMKSLVSMIKNSQDLMSEVHYAYYCSADLTIIAAKVEKILEGKEPNSLSSKDIEERYAGLNHATVSGNWNFAVNCETNNLNIEDSDVVDLMNRILLTTEAMKNEDFETASYYFQSTTDMDIHLYYSTMESLRQLRDSRTNMYTDVIEDTLKLTEDISGEVTLIGYLPGAMVVFLLLLISYLSYIFPYDPITQMRAHDLENYKLNMRKVIHDLKQPCALLINALNDDVIDRELVSAIIMQINSRVHSINRPSNDLQNFTVKNAFEYFTGIHSTYKRLFTIRDVTFDLDINCSEELTLLCAFDDISRCIENFLSNANKFVPDGGHVVLRINTDSQEDEKCTLYIQVEDDGKGLAGVNIDDIWNNNFKGQLDGVGLGLGLSTVKLFAERYGGYTWCAPNHSIGRGAIFGMSILATRCKNNIDVRTSDSETVSHDNIEKCQYKVLVVDDDPIQLTLNCRVLQKFPFSIIVEKAMDGFSGLKMMRNNQYDAVITDMNMPIMNGADMIKKARDEDVLPEFYALLSANTFEEGFFEEYHIQEENYYDKTSIKKDAFSDLNKWLEDRQRV